MPLSPTDIQALHSELARRRTSDPLASFQLHPKQSAFVSAVLSGIPRDEYYECWYVGANRTGKSTVGANIGARLARYGPPTTDSHGSIQITSRATSGWVISRNLKTNSEVIQPQYFKSELAQPDSPMFIPEWEIDSFNKNEQTLKLKNGSIIVFKNNTMPTDAFSGAAKDWIHFDEEPDKRIYDECVIRISAQKKLLTFGTCTILPPEGELGGVSWLYSEKLRPWQLGQLPNVYVITASMYDNPYLSPAEISKAEARYAEGSIERRIRIEGELLPGLTGARAYTSFNPEIHIRDLGPINPDRPLIWAWDFNVQPFITELGQLEDTVMKWRAELYLEQGSIEDMVDYFRGIYPEHRSVIQIYGDATGNSRSSQTNESSYRLIRRYMRNYPAPLTLHIPKNNPSVPARINSTNLMLMDEDKQPWMLVSPQCEHLIADYTDVVRDKLGGIKKSRDPSNPYFYRTHASDAVGYWAAHARPVAARPHPTHKKMVTVRAPLYGQRRRR